MFVASTERFALKGVVGSTWARSTVLPTARTQRAGTMKPVSALARARGCAATEVSSAICVAARVGVAERAMKATKAMQAMEYARGGRGDDRGDRQEDGEPGRAPEP